MAHHQAIPIVHSDNSKLSKFLSSNREKLEFPDFSTKYYVQIQPKQIGQYKELALKLIHNPNIIDLYRTGREGGLLAIVRTKGLKGFNLFIQNLYKNYKIVNTHSTVVIDEIIPTIYPPTMKIAEEICKNNK